MQKHIIAHLFHKINPFFKKISEKIRTFGKRQRFSRDRGSGGAEAPETLSRGIFHKMRPPVLCPRKSSRNCTICQILAGALCKPGNEYPHFLHNCAICGKAMWTTMWRMWKTLSFQHHFGIGSFPQPPGKNCITRCISTLRDKTFQRLRRRIPPVKIRRKSGESFENVGKIPFRPPGCRRRSASFL